MSDPRRVVAFAGAVRARLETGPLGLTLEGHPVEAPAEEISLAFAFAGRAPPAIPATLHDVLVEQLAGESCGADPAGDARAEKAAMCFRLSSGRDQWRFRAADCHLHREVSASFYRAVPPRAAPWVKRMFWRWVLRLAGRPSGRRLLMALRRR